MGGVQEVQELGRAEQRVLGALLEKQRTVPDSYPLSANALRTACNQTSSRDPVIDLDQATVEATARALKDRGLLRIVWSETGRRTLRYHQILDQVLDLGEDEAAVLTVLLLRGPQAAGELRARTTRMHAFGDRDDVEGVLRTLAARPEPLVRELARRPGQQDPRWVHLLGPVNDAAGHDPASGVAAAGTTGADDRDSVLAAGGEARDARVRTSYDAVAAAYAGAMVDELADLPFETWLLDRVAALAVADGGPVVEVGTGPGHVAAYLTAAGASATGIDLAPAMVEQARLRFPGTTYAVGDLRRLMRPTTSDGWSAVLAWYSLIHLAASELPEAVAALVRPLRPGGLLVLGLHAGATVRHVDAWLEHEVDLDFVLHEPAELCALVEAAGLVDLEWYRRGPLVARGEQSERLYLLARAPG